LSDHHDFAAIAAVYALFTLNVDFEEAASSPNSQASIDGNDLLR
jgi:hypothetical protein